MRWKNHHKPLSILSIWWIMAIAKTWFHLLSADDLFAPSHVVALLTSLSLLLVVIMPRNQPGLRFRYCSTFICHFNWKWSTVHSKAKRKEKKYWKNVSCNFCDDCLENAIRSIETFYMSSVSILTSFNYRLQFVALCAYWICSSVLSL